MDAITVISFLGIFVVFWLVGKILVALAHTWVGDLLLGSDKPKKTWVQKETDWHFDPANRGTSTYWTDKD